MSEPRSVLDFVREDDEGKHYGARMPTALHERARKYVFDHKISFNKLLILALETFLDRADQEKTPVSSQVTSTYKVDKSETGERTP